MTTPDAVVAPQIEPNAAYVWRCETCKQKMPRDDRKSIRYGAHTVEAWCPFCKTFTNHTTDQ